MADFVHQILLTYKCRFPFLVHRLESEQLDVH